MWTILTVAILCIQISSIHGQDGCTVFNFEEDNFGVVFEDSNECEGHWQREVYDDTEIIPPEHATHYITPTGGTACAGTAQNVRSINGATLEIVFHIEVPEETSVEDLACIEIRERNDNNVIIERCISTTEFENGWHRDEIEIEADTEIEDAYIYLRGHANFIIDSLRYVESTDMFDECNIYQLEDTESSHETETEETQETESDETQETESDETQETESDETQETESDDTQESQEIEPDSSEETDDAGLSVWIIVAIVVGCVLVTVAVAAVCFLIGRNRAEKKSIMPYPYAEEIAEVPSSTTVPRAKAFSSVNAEEIMDIPGSSIITFPRAKATGYSNSSTLQSNPSYNNNVPNVYKLEIHNHFGR